MRRYILILLILLEVSIVIQAEPYKPYPILFVHGINSGSGTWGAEVENREEGDWIPAEKVDSFSTYYHFLRYMHPYVWMLDTLGYDTTFTIPGGIPGWPKDPAYPNKTFLEVERSVLRESCFYERNGELLPKNIKKNLTFSEISL